VRWREHPEFGRNVLSPTGDEDSSAVSAEDAKFESRWRVIIDPTVEAGFGGHRRRGDGDARRCKSRGNPGIHKLARPGEEDAGQPKNSPSARPEDAGFGATRGLIGKAGLEEQNLG
jgi:hypothetical protein